MKPIVIGSIALAAAALVAGCGGARRTNAYTTTPPTTQEDATQPASGAALAASARRALNANYRLSLYVLWHNKLPPWARQSTRGPALAGLRSSAEGRKKRGVHIRVIDRKLDVVALKLDPSYTSATATIQSRQHVRPYRGGSPLGKAIRLNERARVELHRVGATDRFVVWKVEVLR